MAHRVTWLSSCDELPAELWAACFPPEREGLWWFQTFERAGLGEQFTFTYARIDDGDRPVGIAPAFVFNVPFELSAPPALVKPLRFLAGTPVKRLTYQRTLFIGSVAGEEGYVGLTGAHSLLDVAPMLHDAALREAARRRAGMLVWKDFEDSFAAALDPLVTARGCFKIPSYPGTGCPLVAGGFDAYLATLKSSRRHQVRKKLKRGQALAALTTEVLRHPGDAVIAELFPLFWQTYEKGATKFERLNEQWFREAAKHDVAHFVVLRDAGRAVAFMLCFALGARVVNKFIGIDYAYDAGERYLYFQLFAAAYDWAATVPGAKTFQSGQTGYRAKLDLGNELIPLHNYCRHRLAPVNFLFSKLTAGLDWSGLDADLSVYLTAHPEHERG